MKAQLHYHPSFFSKRDRPSLLQVLRQADKKDIDLLTITSFSKKTEKEEHIDLRWNYFLSDMEAQKGNVEEFDVKYWHTPLKGTSQGIIATKKDNSSSIYLIHGQGIWTNLGDIMILFAEQRVPVEEIEDKFYNFLTEAKHEKRFGKRENMVMGIPHPNRSTHLSSRDLKKLYEDGYIDYIERFNALNTFKGNLDSEKISRETDIPGIAVTDGHKLKDIANAITVLYINPQDNNRMTYEQMGNITRQCIRNKDFDTNENYLPITSKLHYVFNLAMAMVFPEYNPAPNSNARQVIKNINPEKETIYYKEHYRNEQKP